MSSCVSISLLGGVVGVLVALLVVLVIGWSLSCVALVKRDSITQKQTQYVHNSIIYTNCKEKQFLLVVSKVFERLKLLSYFGMRTFILT